MRIALGAAAVIAALLLVLVPAGQAAFASSDPVAAVTAALSAQENNTNPNTNLGYLFAVYIITWAGFFAYIFIVSRRQRALERQVDDLKKLLGEKQSTEKG